MNRRAFSWIIGILSVGVSVGLLQGQALANTSFGLASFQMSSCVDRSNELGLDFTCGKGGAYTQAGGTPYEFTTKLELKSELDMVPGEGFGSLIPAGGNPRDLAVDLPPGLIVDPQAAGTCSLAIFDAGGTRCPASSQIGTVVLVTSGNATQHPLFNLTPQLGRPAQFGIANVNGVNFVIDGSVRTGEDYGVSAISSGLPTIGVLTSATVTLWGVPADPTHDPQRGLTCNWFTSAPAGEPFACERNGIRIEKGHELGGEPSGDPPTALVRLPTYCSGEPLAGVAATDSWESPAQLNVDGSRNHADPTWKAATATLPAVTGCGALSLTSSFTVQPDNTTTGEPAGLTITLKVPQTDDPTLDTAPHVRKVRVELPMGMVVSPSAAQGLTTCRDDPGADPRVQSNELGPTSISPASCNPSSQIGTVQVVSPDLALPLDGHVFLGTPLCGPCSPADAQDGRMFRLYLELVGEGSDGLTVKLVGNASIDQQTGRVTTTFAENPQLPFETLTLSLGGGQKATLANPRVCGLAVTSADLEPWSAPFTPDALATSRFEVTGCRADQFSPSFVAGTTSNQAGSFSPFTLAFGREDADQFLNGVQLRMPPGLLGMISNVSLCGEPQAAQGSCGAESLIGHTQVLTGPGSSPFLVPEGQVFITGPYKGAPYGLSIVVPATAGPYALTGTTGSGTVVVRAAINIDPSSAQVIVTSDPLPTMLDGIPLQLRAVKVNIDRTGFVLNPTDCNPLHIDAALSSNQGAISRVASSFQVANCAALGFRPKFSVRTSGRTSRVNGASLYARLVYPTHGSQANVARVKVDLPRQLPSRLPTLQHACTATRFEVNAASCPAESVVGIARASTPVLPEGLSGPVYFVSHGGQAFPSLVVVLQGGGVRVDLVGSTFISKAGITSSTFGSIPDVPVSTFELYLPQGRHSALAANGRICNSKLVMPTMFEAQNGVIIRRATPIAVTGCAKAKSAPVRRHTRNKHHPNGKSGGRQ